jgi:hypothetical protein
MRQIEPRRFRGAFVDFLCVSFENDFVVSSGTADPSPQQARDDNPYDSLCLCVSGVNCLPDHGEFVHGPVNQDGFAEDVFLINRTEGTTVIGHGAMVAENEVSIFRHRGLDHRAEIKVVGRDIRLSQGNAIDVNLSLDDADVIARNSDYALDVALCRIEWVVEDNDVPPLDGLKLIDELVYENALLVLQTGEHAGAFHLYRLIEKDDDKGRYSDGYEEITNPAPHVSVPTRLDGCSGRGLRHLSAGLGGLLHC